MLRVMRGTRCTQVNSLTLCVIAGKICKKETAKQTGILGSSKIRFRLAGLADDQATDRADRFRMLAPMPVGPLKKTFEHRQLLAYWTGFCWCHLDELAVGWMKLPSCFSVAGGGVQNLSGERNLGFGRSYHMRDKRPQAAACPPRIQTPRFHVL